MELEKIARCVIHPGIGVARIGNSPREYFVGPEVPGAPPETEDGLFKDEQGRLRRQVARFRIYGFDEAGNVVKELTADDAEITWTVHPVNKKAAWYCFDLAPDIPKAKPNPRRNAGFPGNRKSLVIDPGAQQVCGRNDRAKFDQGMFLGINVSLGEIRTDGDGHLLVFGGLGNSDSVLRRDITLNEDTTNFDEGGWYDDTSDGPVFAEVKIGNRVLTATPAWVVVAPPDYTPGITSAVTLYDIAYEVAVNANWIPAPTEVSFTEHILPIFHRLSQLQWVNEGFYLDYGWGAPDDFLNPDNLSLLSDNSPASKAHRKHVFDKFREPDYKQTKPSDLPPMYGDGFTWPPNPDNPRNWLTLPKLHYGWLKQWAKGNFLSDWNPDAPPGPTRLEDVPLQRRPQALDQAALENCVGGPFHPGCEMSWPMRHAMMYSSAFRIRHRDQPEKNYGAQLTPKEATAPDGPLNGSAPGDLTRWMYVPWQVDTTQCGAGYQPTINPYFPTFWPARVPNQVLTAANYQQALSPGLSNIQRLKYFGLRQNWLRDLTVIFGYQKRIEEFLREWNKVGIISRQETPPGYEWLPPFVHIETQNELEENSGDRFLAVDARNHP